MKKGRNTRDDKWTKSIAVGNRGFEEEIKRTMGVIAKGRKCMEAGGSYQLREPPVSYGHQFEGKKDDIEPQNAYFLER